VDFKGPEAVFSNASLQTWRRVMDKAYNSYKLAMRSLGQRIQGFPTVAYMTPGSIVWGIKTGEKRSLFDLSVEQSEAPEKAMRVLLATASWLNEGGELPAEIADDDAAIETMLRAIEELSPLSQETEVFLSRVGTDERAEFTYKTRAAAKQRRIELRMKNSEARKLELIGIISKLEDSGEVTARSGIYPGLEGKARTV
jgi:hypothetical protein